MVVLDQVRDQYFIQPYVGHLIPTKFDHADARLIAV